MRRGAVIVAMLTLLGCASGAPYVWRLPEGFPPPRVPEDNPMSVEKIELGRHLFYDRRLSANGEQACASCHQPDYAFSDPRPLSRGSTGEVTRRNTLTLTNMAYNTTFMWTHPGLTKIEQQLLISLFGSEPVELGISGAEEEVLARLHSIRAYQQLFAAAFPATRDPFTFNNVVKALATPIPTMIKGCPNSPATPCTGAASARQRCAISRVPRRTCTKAVLPPWTACSISTPPAGTWSSAGHMLATGGETDSRASSCARSN